MLRSWRTNAVISAKSVIVAVVLSLESWITPLPVFSVALFRSCVGMQSSAADARWLEDGKTRSKGLQVGHRTSIGRLGIKERGQGKGISWVFSITQSSTGKTNESKCGR
jgi:hypothetical protein